MTSYELISTRDHAGTKLTKTVSVESEGPKWLMGNVVNKGGEWTGTVWYIDKSTITKRRPLTMNLTYGELEVTS